MKRFLRVPSPAIVVAVIALAVALGGSAYAAIVITGKNVRNGTLTGADIKGRSIEGTDIQKDRVGYNAVKEEGLNAQKFKKVKAASSADTFGGMAARRVGAFTLANDQSRAVLTEGPFTLTARCRTDGANQIAEIVIQTNANDAAMDGAQKDTDLDVGETPQLVAATGPTGTPAFDQESAGAAIATDGTELLGQELYAGTSVLAQANQCRFGGVVYAG
jgi:hypothetical protein